MNKFKMIITGFFCLALVACGGDGFEGKYADANGPQGLSFNSNGTVTQFLLGKQVAEFKYNKDGSKVTIHVNDSTAMILTLQDDGSIVDPMGTVYKKEG